MRRKAIIETALTDRFAPLHLEVEDESHRHRGHREGGEETHFRVLVVSEAFTGKPLVARHRMINESLAGEFRSGLHALSLATLTPDEWRQRGGGE